MSEFRIDFAADYPQYLDVIAPWHHAQWQHLDPAGASVTERIERYRHELNRTRIPLLLVAHDGRRVFGSARLIENDMDTHPEWTPWLASLYVHPDVRGRGIATALIRRAEALAGYLDYPRLYLFTEDGEAFYRQRGWELLSHETYRGEAVSVMQRRLAGE